MPKQVSKSSLKARMLEYFREVERTGEELVVTDNRVPVLRILPIRTRSGPNEIFADIRGKAELRRSELLASLEDEWETK